MTGPSRGPAGGVVWAGPGDFGAPAAFDNKIGVAAPLLAGFSLALLGVVGQAPVSFRWPGLTMTVLVAVLAALVGSIQCGFRGRAVLYSRAEVEAWGPLTDLDAAAEQALRRDVQRRDMAEWRVWHRRTQLLYNAGVVLLGVAVALVLAPPSSYLPGSALPAGEAGWRWTGYGLALACTAGEVAWVLSDELRTWEAWRALRASRRERLKQSAPRRREETRP